MKTKAILIYAFLLLFASISTVMASSICVENSDAGSLLGSAQLVPGGINRIDGNISFYGDVDLYKLSIGYTADVSVHIQVASIATDDWFAPDLTIFNQYGNPLFVRGQAYNFTWSVTPGTYYFAIADWDIAALNASTQVIADDSKNILKTSEVLGGWSVMSVPYNMGPYEISFSVSTIPEPASVMLIGAGLFFIRSRRQTELKHELEALRRAGPPR